MSDFDEKKHTTSPTTTGSSVVGVKFDKGVIIVSDNKISCHGYKKYDNISRISRINTNTIIGSSGEYSDFQELNRILIEKAEFDELYNGYDSFLGPKELSSYLSYICYEKRCKMNPYWNTTIVGGIDWEGKPFMNSVDLYGTKYSNTFLVSGFATYFAGPLLENAIPKDSNISKEKAIELIDSLFRVLFYRDSTAGDTLYYGIMEKDESNNIEYNLLEKKLVTNWEHQLFKLSHNERYHPTA